MTKDKPAPREKPREPPDWLKKISETPSCKECGVIMGGCLLEVMGKKCKRYEEAE